MKDKVVMVTQGRNNHYIPATVSSDEVLCSEYCGFKSGLEMGNDECKAFGKIKNGQRIQECIDNQDKFASLFAAMSEEEKRHALDAHGHATARLHRREEQNAVQDKIQ